MRHRKEVVGPTSDTDYLSHIIYLRLRWCWGGACFGSLFVLSTTGMLTGSGRNQDQNPKGWKTVLFTSDTRVMRDITQILAQELYTGQFYIDPRGSEPLRASLNLPGFPQQ